MPKFAIDYPEEEKKKEKKKPAVVAPVAAVPTVPVTPPPPPPEFPKIKLKGITTRDGVRMALIDGGVYAVGDKIGEAVIVRIDREEIRLTLGERTNVVSVYGNDPRLIIQR
jgi:hypothetical protein